MGSAVFLFFEVFAWFALLYTVVITSNCPSLCEIHVEPFKTLQNQNFHIPPLTPCSLSEIGLCFLMVHEKISPIWLSTATSQRSKSQSLLCHGDLDGLAARCTPHTNWHMACASTCALLELLHLASSPHFVLTHPLFPVLLLHSIFLLRLRILVWIFSLEPLPEMPRNEHAAVRVAKDESFVNSTPLTKTLSTSTGLN